jgi:4-amino-4-deoxy-L-arabinose transferase-like glycosyltransferase
MLKNISSIVAKNKFVTLLLLIGILLRFYNLENFTVFLSDQGRDTIIVKRIVTLENLPLIGPPTSIGQVFMGPFFYYLLAPFLLLFNFHPIGMTVGVAVLSVIGIVLSYLVVKKQTSFYIALFFLFLIVFSQVQIEFARFAWNPNLLPIFAFLTLYFFYLSVTKHRLLFSFVYGALFALSVQLHYLAIFLSVPLAVFFVETVVRKGLSKAVFKNIGAAIGGFLVFFSPLILFDLRHGFINGKSFLKLFTQKDFVAQSSLLNRFYETSQAFINHLFKLEINQATAFFIILGICAAFILVYRFGKRNAFVRLNFYAVILYLFLFGMLTSARHPHYFTAIYYSFYLILAFLFISMSRHFYFKYILIPAFIIFYLVTNAQHFHYFRDTGWSQMAHSQRVARFMAEKIGDKPFNVATWPIAFGEDNYMYFLEVEGHVPAARERLEVTEQMFVLCNEEPCLVVNSPSWNISMFGPAKVADKWEIEGITIYKLIHEKK